MLAHARSANENDLALAHSHCAASEPISIPASATLLVRRKLVSLNTNQAIRSHFRQMTEFIVGKLLCDFAFVETRQ